MQHDIHFYFNFLKYVQDKRPDLPQHWLFWLPCPQWCSQRRKQVYKGEIKSAFRRVTVPGDMMLDGLTSGHQVPVRCPLMFWLTVSARGAAGHCPLLQVFITVLVASSLTSFIHKKWTKYEPQNYQYMGRKDFWMSPQCNWSLPQLFHKAKRREEDF